MAVSACSARVVLTSTSCYNAFSRLDMRVQVQIPGTVESYCVNERGDKLEASEEHWLETYLCSVLRAYSYADTGSGDVIKKIVGVRRFNPITNTESEHKFLDAAERLFFSGKLLMADTSPLTNDETRLAAGFGSRDSGAKLRIEPPYHWTPGLHSDHWPLCVWYQSLRETADEGS